MGNSNCISCINYTTLRFIEDGSNHLEIKSKPNQYTTMSTDYDYHSITLIQASWRGYNQKKHYQFMKKLISSSTFFPKTDLLETLSDRKLCKDLDIHKYEYLSGTVYEGHWLGGFRFGYGVAVWPDKSKYEGCWQFGYPYGKGTFFHSDGEVFKGNWVNPYSTFKDIQDKKNGFGKFYLVWLSMKTQIKPRKSFSHHKQIELLDNSIKGMEAKIELLKEEFLENKPENDFFDKSGTFYQGLVVAGEKQGYGISVWGNGDKFTGFWKNNQKHGLGKEEWIDGSYFFGQFVNGYKEGIGQYIWEDGTSYTGGWLNNKYEGIGTHTWPDGRCYKGNWKNGLMHGFGIFTWPNGLTYEGDWYLGKKHGLGLSKYPNSTNSEDIWEFGKIKKSN